MQKHSCTGWIETACSTVTSSLSPCVALETMRVASVNHSSGKRNDSRVMNCIIKLNRWIVPLLTECHTRRRGDATKRASDRQQSCSSVVSVLSRFSYDFLTLVNQPSRRAVHSRRPVRQTLAVLFTSGSTGIFATMHGLITRSPAVASESGYSL